MQCDDLKRRLRAVGRASLVALLALGAVVAQAQDGSEQGEVTDFELTITLLPRGATEPEALTRRIELPPTAQAGAAAQGLSRANEARGRREAGLDTAIDAVEQGREHGQAMREQAAEARENAGRGEPPEPPRRPDVGPPDSPGNPDSPGKPQ